jgi:hypothetical protein
VSNGLSAYLQFPFVLFGREDLVIRVEGQVSDTETIDPVTGQQREISGDLRRYWSVDLRREPGDGWLSWGFSIQHYVESDYYSVRSSGTSRNDREWSAFVEWEPVPDLKIRTNLSGPGSWYSIESLYPSVRTPVLEPSFLTSTRSYTDRYVSISVEWRRREHIEISGSLSNRPRTRTFETLTPFGGPSEAPFIREVATTPRATLRIRYYR